MRKVNKTRVKDKLSKGFITAVSISNVAAIISLLLMLILDGRYGRALELNGFIQGDIGEYTTTIQKSGAYTRDLMLLTDDATIEQAKSLLAECDANADHYFAEFKSKLETTEERELVAQIEEQYPQYIQYRDQAIDLALQGKADEACEIFYSQAISCLSSTASAADSLMKMNVEMGDQVSSSMTTLTRIMLAIIVVVVISGALVAMKLAQNTAKEITTSLQKVNDATLKLANGELDIHVDINSEDEFGEMATNFNQAAENLHSYIEVLNYGLTEVGNGNLTVRPTVEFHGDFIALKEAIEHIIVSLNSTLGQINDGSDQVALGAEQLAQGAQGLAEGATNQAAAIEELTATVENVATAATDSAQQAIEANQTAETFASVADETNREMAHLTEAMERITETSKEIESILLKLKILHLRPISSP